MYLTHSPCAVCAKCIINAGIDEVIYQNEYTPEKIGIKILLDSGISVRTIKE